MEKRYWYVILTYILMQISSLIGVPILLKLNIVTGENTREAITLASTYWIIISFTLGLIITLLLMRRDLAVNDRSIERSPLGATIGWSIGGIFLAMLAQGIAANIEVQLFGVDPGSENTQQIMDLVRMTPFLIIVVSVIGPILEEIIFRKIVFGTLYKRFNFFISALLSSVLFAAVHMEFEHILLYSAMGFTFAFLYVKTKRIIVPIFAHVAMNTLVVVIQTVFAEDIERILEEAEQLQGFISWLI
ncbi:CPBP family intramembrane glutamic endopeptidase [Litchfieldia alkalitelluris]|uniref:CPBP family intramembrane glutamic endopeptidase n=1 Tax=Litchfieldia alkalitelluris TaxID=304268 RepID=UPI0009984548|nr:CPBP family intramembrane glutamic endopeptidase [Litchfieldia alkalitelluris]